MNTTIPSSTQKPDGLNGRLQLLDSWRGIAALLVVLFHLAGAHDLDAFDEASKALAWVLSFGYIGVDLFFVISGFVICLSLDRYAGNSAGFGGFMRARLIRLTPPYWALIAYVAVEYILEGKITTADNYTQVATNLLYLQNLTGHGDLVPVFWTLCYEMQFYLLFGCAYLLYARSGRPGAERQFQAATFVCGLASIYVFFLNPSLVWNGLMFAYFHFFALGIFLYWALQGRTSPLYLGLLCAAFLIAYGIGDHRSAVRIIGLLFVLFLWLVLAKGIDLRILRSRLLLHLGTLSYSLYLAHAVFGWKAVINARPLFESTTLASYLGWLGLGLVGSYLSAVVLYWLAEKPAIAWSKRAARAQPRPAPSAA